MDEIELNLLKWQGNIQRILKVFRETQKYFEVFVSKFYEAFNRNYQSLNLFLLFSI